MYRLLCVMILSMLCLAVSTSAQERDPTTPLFSGDSHGTSKQNVQTIQLQSIIDNGQSYTVIINGKRLQVGDRIEQYQLDKINKNSVVLTSTEKRLELTLFSPVVVKSQ